MNKQNLAQLSLVAAMAGAPVGAFAQTCPGCTPIGGNGSGPAVAQANAKSGDVKVPAATLSVGLTSTGAPSVPNECVTAWSFWVMSKGNSNFGTKEQDKCLDQRLQRAWILENSNSTNERQRYLANAMFGKIFPAFGTLNDTLVQKFGTCVKEGLTLRNDAIAMANDDKKVYCVVDPVIAQRAHEVEVAKAGAPVTRVEAAAPAVVAAPVQPTYVVPVKPPASKPAVKPRKKHLMNEPKC